MRRKDDFPAKVIERLRSRVAHRCSKPDCRVSTAGPGPGELGVAHAGKAAHITAASKGGPRYDETMSSDERRSINNAIWLCSIHADEIDANEKLYPTTLLKEWKLQAEAAAHAEKGKCPPHPDDARNELIQALSGQPVPFTHTAIINVHEASTQRLNSLDPRLTVQTVYANGKTTFIIDAKETVPFRLSVPAALAQEWQEGLANLIDHGSDAKLPATGLKVSGSPLFEQMFSAPNFTLQHVSLESHKKPAVLKLKLLESGTRCIEQFDDSHGSAVLGQRSLRFEGELCQGLISLAFNAQVFDSPCEGAFTLSHAFDRWTGNELCRLPYFEKISRFFELLTFGWILDFCLELDGQNALSGSANTLSVDAYFRRINHLLNYTHLARQVSKHLGVTIYFDASTEISQEDYEVLKDVVDTFEGRRVHGRSSCSENLTCRLIAEDNGNNIRKMLDAEVNGTAITYQAHEGDLISIFGQEIRLPRIEVRLDGATPKIHQAIDTIKDGDSVFVEWVPMDRFKLSFRYMEDDEGPPTDFPTPA